MLVDRLLEPSYISQCAVLYQTNLLGSYIQKKLKYEKKEKSVTAGKQFLIKIIDARKKNSQKQALLAIIWKLLNLLTSSWDWNIFLSMEVIEVKHLILCSSVSVALFCICSNEASQTEERHSGDMQSCWNCKPARESCIDCAFWGIEENHPKNVQDKPLAKQWDTFSEAKVRDVVAAHYFCCSSGNCSKRILLGMLNKEKEKKLSES